MKNYKSIASHQHQELYKRRMADHAMDVDSEQQQSDGGGDQHTAIKAKINTEKSVENNLPENRFDLELEFLQMVSMNLLFSF